MKKALSYLERVSRADEILDLEQQYSVDLGDAREAVRIAYNEGLGKAAVNIINYGLSNITKNEIESVVTSLRE